MTLHGDISVNHQRIGWWDAQRITTSPDGLHTYRWRAKGDHGQLTGTLTHRYDEGAVVLASKVLAAYAGRAACPDCEWAAHRDLCDPLDRYELAHPCPTHQEDQ